MRYDCKSCELSVPPPNQKPDSFAESFFMGNSVDQKREGLIQMCPAVCSVDVEDPRGLGVVKCGMGEGEGGHVTLFTLWYLFKSFFVLMCYIALLCWIFNTYFLYM